MTRTWSTLVLMMAWLTTGYAVVHTTVLVFVYSSIQSTWGRAIPWEGLRVTDEGDVFIETHVGNGDPSTFRRLDGTVVENLGRSQPTSVLPVYMSRNSPIVPIALQHELQTFSDYGLPATNWYLVRSADDPETAYFMGFDCRSRRLTGYLDLNGFTTTAPSTKTSFRIPEGFNSFPKAVAAVQLGTYSREQAYEPGENVALDKKMLVENAVPDAVWILNQGTIVEVRLRARTVRTLITDRPDFESLTAATSLQDGKNVLRLLIPIDAGLVIFDPETATSVVVAMDLSDRSGNLQYYQLKDGRQILTQNYLTRPVVGSYSTHILWIGEAGQIEREAEVPDRIPDQGDSRFEQVAGAFMLPSPAAATAVTLIAPLLNPSRWEPNASYGERLGVSFKSMRLWLAMTFVMGLLSGWACRRREKAVFGSSRWFWPILVGMFGWFGWIGYTCVRPLPARLPGGHWMPAQPESNRPLGTEIFA